MVHDVFARRGVLIGFVVGWIIMVVLEYFGVLP